MADGCCVLVCSSLPWRIGVESVKGSCLTVGRLSVLSVLVFASELDWSISLALIGPGALFFKIPTGLFKTGFGADDGMAASRVFCVNCTDVDDDLWSSLAAKTVTVAAGLA